MQAKNLVILLSCTAALSSCSLFKKKQESSTVTGWNYNDKNQGGFQVSKATEQATGPGLVFVQGGTYTMGQTDEDVMGNWDNIPKRVTVPSFYMDRTEVANVHYREYIHWLTRIFPPDEEQGQKVLAAALPDTLVWRSELSYNEPLVEYYFRHPSFNNYPVVGVSWRQAHDFCLWRSDRVNEGILMKRELIAPQNIKSQQGEDNFTTKSYLLGLYTPQPGKGARSKNGLKDADGRPRTQVTMEDGLLQPDYRLPFESEWEYAAYGLVNQNPRPSRKEGNRGEELQSNKQIYPWSVNVNGLRDTKHGSWQGQFLANFKRGSGDNAGVAGGLNDRAIYTAEVNSFYPNGFGLYNMAGNVSEWVFDVYRPLSNLDYAQNNDDVAPVRGNRFQTLVKNSEGEAERDSMGRVKMRDVTDAESRNRRNYQRGNVINFLDGDSLSNASYGYGQTTLISDKSRVYKGGSWNDRAYWLSPGTRRYLEEDQASSQIGFRCAMDRMGSPEGNKRKTGNFWKSKKQTR